CPSHAVGKAAIWCTQCAPARSRVGKPCGKDAWLTQPGISEDSRLAPSKIQKEVEKLPSLLRRYEPPRIRIDARNAYVLRRTRERALACFDPEDRQALDGERAVLYF